MSRRFFIIAGEPSGDLHGSNLVKELVVLDPEIEIQCWGGDRMKSAGAKVMKHIHELAFMGFVEVAMNLRQILRNFKLCEQQIKVFKPDVVVLIDYPGFNLRMAKTIHALGIPVVYYISPQIWAWKESRVKKVKQFVDHVFVILPFEKPFFEKHGVQAEFVGHPLLDEIKEIHITKAEFCTKHHLDDGKPIVALLPGSRTQEIELLLPEMAALIEQFPKRQFVVSKVAWQPIERYRKYLNQNVQLVEGSTYELLKSAEAAIVTSGTATLETALIGTPQVVVYKANWLSVIIARWLVKIKFISLVNLIMDKEVVKELIQGQASAKNIKIELGNIIEGGERRQAILNEYAQLRYKLGAGGASSIVANKLLKIIDNGHK
ncbi:MAG: lipid-A-disaccharide synthase [Flavobacteriales bacterium]